MNHLNTLTLAVLLMFSFGGTALATDCSEQKDTVSILKCHEQRYAKADQELNVVYSKAMKSLTEAGKLKLKEAQKAWLRYRDASFEFCIEQNKEMRSYGSVVVADYKATLVEKRAQELKYLLAGPEEPAVTW